jgi:hypothetical protein
VEDQERVRRKLLLFQVIFSPEDCRGTNTARIYVIKGGAPVPVSDWTVVPTFMPEE